LVELAIATVVLLVGVVAVIQLVPNAIRLNLWNRYDSTSTVVAQRLLDQMLSQPMTTVQFLNADVPPVQISLVGPGAPLVPNTARIDFNQLPVAGYSYNYRDPNDPSGPLYEVRWAVIPTVANGQVIAKRYIVGVWKRDPNQVYGPVTLEAWKQQ